MYLLEHQTTKAVSEGKWHPLGATLTPEGVNFAIYSMNASEVFLLLFDDDRSEPSDIIKLTNRTRYVWHTCVHGLKAGQFYAYKVRGEFNPAIGMRFNEHKCRIEFATRSEEHTSELQSQR